MLLETIKTPGLAHLSYLLGDVGSGVCAVIDPRRDVEVYLDVAQAHEVRITHIFETHIHADFVSGSLELAARTGATVCVGASGAYGFDHHTLNNGDVVTVGPFALRVLHTPGHSLEHVCLVVKGGGKGAEHDWAVFTGDTLFAGEVGRPDLITEKNKGEDRDKEALAGKLYGSLHDKLLTLEDGVEVYPAHGEGSPCGGSIGARDRTTIGYERLHNPKLGLDKETFVKEVLSNLPAEPFYYARMKRVNAEGPDVLGLWPPPPVLTPAQFGEELEKADTVVLDVREIDAFAGAHISGSLNIALRKAFPIWAGWMLRPEQRILLVLPPNVGAAEVQTQLLRIGIEDVVGTLQKGMRGWIEAGKPFETTGRLSVQDLKETLETGNPLQLLDVRNDEEWEAGHIPTAKHAFLPFLPKHLDELDPKAPTAVYCGSGFRSSIAVSLLKKNGFKEVYNVLGSMSAWKGAGYGLEGSGE